MAAKEYARLDLLQEITAKNGATAKEIVVLRPTCRQMTDVLDTQRVGVQIERFVNACVRAVNGGAEPLEFAVEQLNALDGAELTSVINAMSEEADAVVFDTQGADGVTEPIVYTLQHPIKLARPNGDGETIHQLSFEARRVKDISEFLDARGETREFQSFMRSFAKPLGVSMPVLSESIINALDFVDYLVIRRQIMGKFTFARGRWKRAS